MKKLGTFLAACAALAALLLLIPAWTPGIAGERAIASLETVRLGGAEQWLLVRGRDRSSPVLLYLHGGPGGGYIPLARHFSSRLEEHFVVVHWDQRGAGKSCASGVPDESLHLEQYLADTVELVRLLQRRFGARKLYLVGHSWGSVLGVLAVQRHPELFHAYVGLGQVVSPLRGEEISHRFAVERATADGNERALEDLAAARPPYASPEALVRQRLWLDHYRGTVHAGSAVWGLVRALVLAPEYTTLEKLRYTGCLMNSVEHVWGDLEGLDFMRSVRRLDVPVYLFTGRHDYTVPFELVEEWAGVLEAPRVEIVWFEESGHNACLEEPERFQAELIERVLAETG